MHRSGRLPVLGVDVGGVIVCRAGDDADTSFFLDHPMDTPAVPRAFEFLHALTHAFEGRVHIVSKAHAKTAETTMAWFDHVGFELLTGIDRENIHFVANRSDKAPLCRELRVTHFVDDCVDVLTSLTTVPYRYLFLGGLGRHQRPDQIPEELEVADNWRMLHEYIQVSLARTRQRR
jgi:hypothetical protein